MAITRQKKEELVQSYRELIEGSAAMVFTDYRGSSVAQIQSLRTRLREHNTPYVVVKNSLLGVALTQLGRVTSPALLSETRGVAFIGEDIGSSVKALTDWIREAKVMSVAGAILENSILDAAAAQSLSELPTREQMLAKLLGTVNAPATNLVRMISAPQASLVRVINARAEKQQEAAAA